MKCSYIDIAHNEKLYGMSAVLYNVFMVKRFGLEEIIDFAYATEWAQRFKNNKEYEYSDETSREILSKTIDQVIKIETDDELDLRLKHYTELEALEEEREKRLKEIEEGVKNAENEE